jgi:hypothetical protein
MHSTTRIFLRAITIIFPAVLLAQDTLQLAITPPAPPTALAAFDTPNDNGHAISLTWKLSADDGSGRNNVTMYEILRAESPEGEFVSRGVVDAGVSRYDDKGDKDKASENYLPSGRSYFYKVRAKVGEVYSESEIVGPAAATGQWYHTGKTIVLLFVGIFMIFVLIFIKQAQSGKELYIRPIAGIAAVDEAIGRATEMGRPILYVMGLGAPNDIASIASYTILGRIAKKTAEYQTPILVPCNDPIMMSIAQETVRGAYLDAGRPDAYRGENIFFVTTMQFAYVAAVNGIMLRERTATNFYLGKFFAESLILAETGSVAGSIQISGTDEVAQIPFFVAATDYTLIGEELYAASAYLGREPLLLGALKAQDWAKGLIMTLLILGVLAATLHWDFFVKLFTIKT